MTFFFFVIMCILEAMVLEVIIYGSISFPSLGDLLDGKSTKFIPISLFLFGMGIERYSGHFACGRDIVRL